MSINTEVKSEGIQEKQGDREKSREAANVTTYLACLSYFVTH